VAEVTAGGLKRRPAMPMCPVAVAERREIPMTMHIAPADRPARWDRSAAVANLRQDWQKLAADVAARAERRVIAADKAAVVESRLQVAQVQGTHLVDITV